MTDAALYTRLAEWWPLLSSPADYAEEAAFYGRALKDACSGTAATMLELGSGGGNNASFLGEDYALTLTDVSPAMLRMSRRLNPDCEHIEGDMRSLRLGRTFDTVFVHDAITYMTREADLRRAIHTAFVHTREGGAALFAPDHVRESFVPSTSTGGHDGEDGRALRYVQWTWDPDPEDTTYIVDYAYLLRGADGSVDVEHDRHVEGLFPRATWLRLLAETGYDATVVPFEHSEVEEPIEVFIATRPEASTPR